MSVLDDMNDLDFEEYRQRLFHTNLTYFEKAIEKSKYGNRQNPVEMKYVSEIAENFEIMQ